MLGLCADTMERMSDYVDKNSRNLLFISGLRQHDRYTIEEDTSDDIANTRSYDIGRSISELRQTQLPR